MMRNFGQWRASILLASLLACVAAPDAGAQSLFQSIFGNLFKSAPPKPAPAPSVSISPHRMESNFPGFYDMRPQVEPGQSSSGGAYRTVCVRSCDGYYFPISGSASRGQFRKDAESCTARCGGGRLYYLPRNSEDMAAMVDLTGRRYDQLASAFVYRKKLIDGCVCRPMPWTAVERARHNRYAYAEEINRLNEARFKQRREETLARANEPPVEYVAQPVDSMAPPPATVAEAVPGSRLTTAAGAVGSGEETDFMNAIAVNAVPGLEPAQGQDAIAETASYSPRRAATARAAAKAKPRRARNTARKTSSANSWSNAGGGKYTWPGDR